jgi:AcrR family transcriptional regulator
VSVLIACIIEGREINQVIKTRSKRVARRRPRGVTAGKGATSSTRERILAAALEVFAERGFDGARTRDIAERAGANLGLLPYYFGGKLQLWRAAVASAFEELQRELLAPDAGDDADLERLLRGFVHFVAKRPAFMRLMNDEGKRDGPRMRWVADHHVRPLADALRHMVEAAERRGTLPPIHPVSVHYFVVGAGLLFSQAPECAYLTGVDPTAEGFAEAHADALVRLLLGR